MGSCTWENSGTRDERVGSITYGESTITRAHSSICRKGRARRAHTIREGRARRAHSTLASRGTCAWLDTWLRRAPPQRLLTIPAVAISAALTQTLRW